MDRVSEPRASYDTGRAGPSRLTSGDLVELGRLLDRFLQEHPTLVDATAGELRAEVSAAAGVAT